MAEHRRFRVSLMRTIVHEAEILIDALDVHEAEAQAKVHPYLNRLPWQPRLDRCKINAFAEPAILIRR